MFDTESSDPQSSDEKLYSIKHYILFFRWNLIQVNIFQKRNTFPETDILTYIFLRNWLLFQQIMCVYYVLRAYRQICNFIADLANYIDIFTNLISSQQFCTCWQVDYCSSKFAAVGLDEAFRVELFVQVSWGPFVSVLTCQVHRILTDSRNTGIILMPTSLATYSF
jgi:hypothetical protein